jgi:hypothetical protein
LWKLKKINHEGEFWPRVMTDPSLYTGASTGQPMVINLVHSGNRWTLGSPTIWNASITLTSGIGEGCSKNKSGWVEHGELRDGSLSGSSSRILSDWPFPQSIPIPSALLITFREIRRLRLCPNRLNGLWLISRADRRRWGQTFRV